MSELDIPKLPFGPTGVEVPVIGQGTYAIQHDRRAAIKTLQAGIELGLTHIDTAEMYGSGSVERVVGEAIEGRREQVFLVSKIMPQNATRGRAEAACDQSLQYLGTDYLDCYLLHWAPSDLKEALDQLQELQAKGKIRSWGVSNFDETLMQKVLEHVGPNVMACNQVLYYVKERAVEHKVLPFCEQNGIAPVAYSPFGQFDFPRGAQLQALREVGDEHGKSAHQVALAYLLRNPKLFVIPRTTNLQHLQQNAEAYRIELSDEQLARLEAAFPLERWRPGVPRN